MKRTLSTILFLGVLSSMAFGQMDMLPQIFRDLPPEFQEGLPEDMSFAEYRKLNRNVDFLTMFMSIFIPGYGSFQVERPGLGWTIAGVRVAGTAMMGAAVALQWNHFYALVGDATVQSADFQRLLGNAFLFGGGVVVHGLAWAADVTIAYHIAKNEKDLVQYAYGIRASLGQAGSDQSAPAREERFLRTLLNQPDDPRVRDELARGLTRFAGRYPDAPFASEALYFRALLHAEDGEDALALARALRAIRIYPDGPRVHDAIRLMSRLVERNREEWALDLETVTSLTTIPSSGEDLEWRAYSVGSLLYAAVRRSESDALADAALDESRAFVERFPHSRFVPDSLLIIAELLSARRMYADAASYLAVVVIGWQEHPEWIRAALRLGRLYSAELADPERAGIVLRAVVERMPATDEAAAARDLLSDMEGN